MWILLAIGAALTALVTVLLLRALCFRPRRELSSPAKPVEIDQQGAVHALQQLIRCRTVSHVDPRQEEDGEFEKLIDLLPRLYPNVFRVCSFQRFPDQGGLLHWPGKHPGDARVMMAHYDVVDVDESQWDKPPFEGIIEEGVLWGRGTLDTKVTVNGILWAAEELIRTGFQPDKDLYFAFSGSEEINGHGAKHIVEYFRSRGITLSMVLDEGGAVVENVFPGVRGLCGLVGIAEKGMMNVEYSVTSNGGHASAPPVKTPVRSLSKACLRVLKHPFPMYINEPARRLMDTLGRHSSFGYKLIFANLWCFRPVLDLYCRLTGGEMNALVRTTTAFTQMEGSNARNVLPTKASLISNMRLNPGDTVAQAEQRLGKLVAPEGVQVRVLEAFEASPISETDCDGYRTLKAVIGETWPGCIVSPYLMVQCSDARHYGSLSDRVYRFCPLTMSGAERKTIHGNNERIPIESIVKCVEFYIRLMKQC